MTLRTRKFLIAGVLLAAVAAMATPFIPLDTPPYLGVKASGRMLDRHGSVLFVALNDEDNWCFPRELSEFSPRLIAATLAAEDQRFYQHPGVDPVAIARAVKGRLSGGARSGASTLTMQVVNLGGHRSGSWWGKLVQAHTALRLDAQTGKDSILAAYLNKAPYGFNLIGAEAASQRYFGKSAGELTLAEAALLAGLPKAPTRFQPLRAPERARARRSYVLRRMQEDGAISAAEREAAEAAPLGAAWNDFPRLAPHLAREHSAAMKSGGEARVTLDAAIQARTEEIVRRYLRRFDNEITNAAVMVVDVDTAKVLARVGSADYWKAPGGQVDMCSALRSPGSALKPFTFALAMERGLLYPAEKLLDDTIDFGSYAPENFDGIFNGLVSAGQALQMSLNVPAVAMLDRVGLSEMQRFLQRAGISTLLHAPSHYGLGLTLGNCGIRLDELCGAYLMLARMGEWRAIQHTDTVPQEGVRLLRPDTAYAIYRMLEHPFPREMPGALVKSSTPPTRVCWKTGTSTGFHDAWTVAFNRHYVVGVWTGNADGRPSPRLVGALAALPLAGTIFRALPARSTPAWPDDAGLEQLATVCAVSGLPVGTSCPTTEAAPFPSGMFLNRKCDVHHPGPDGAAVERWPADARHWDLANIGSTVSTSAHAREAARKQALRIVTPADGAHYVLTGEPEGDRILLRASVEEEVLLHWYQDGVYLGDSAAGQPRYLSLSKGGHALTCMAPEGMADTVRFTVE
jgi:penicillin-binding protein 1C